MSMPALGRHNSVTIDIGSDSDCDSGERRNSMKINKLN